MSAVLPLVLVATAGGLVLMEADKAPDPGPPNKKSASGGTVVGGAGNISPGSSVKPTFRIKLAIGNRTPPIVGQTGAYSAEVGKNVTTASNTATTSGSNSDDQLLRGKLDTIEAAAKNAYDNLSADAKQKGAEAANAALGTNLTGDEDYATAASVIGGATGAAAGAAIGGPIGAKLGAFVGAYLGVKLEDLIAKNWDDLQNWCSSNWDSVSDAVSSAASDAADAVSSAADDAYNWAAGAV